MPASACRAWASSTGLQAADNQGDYKYNSLQLTLRKQMSHGLSFQAAYAHSRAFYHAGLRHQHPAGTGVDQHQRPDASAMAGLNPQYRPEAHW